MGVFEHLVRPLAPILLALNHFLMHPKRHLVVFVVVVVRAHLASSVRRTIERVGTSAIALIAAAAAE